MVAADSVLIPSPENTHEAAVLMELSDNSVSVGLRENKTWPLDFQNFTDCPWRPDTRVRVARRWEVGEATIGQNHFLILHYIFRVLIQTRHVVQPG